MRGIFFICILFCVSLNAQVLRSLNSSITGNPIGNSLNDTILNGQNSQKPSDSLKIYHPTIYDYNVRKYNSAFHPVDTVLSVYNFYKQNEYGRDLFAYQIPENLGLPLNPLTLDSRRNLLEILPKGKSYMYQEVDSIKFYDVKTPLTQFIYENGVEEGQYLSTTFTHNIHSRWNYGINYNYLNSLGNYLNTGVKNTSLVFQSSYKTKNNRYKVQAALVSHHLNNNENGGVNNKSILAYIENNSNFTDRKNMFSNLQNATSKFDEKRIQFQQQFGLLSFGRSKADSTISTNNYPIFLKHELIYKHQGYDYEEKTPSKLYDSIILGSTFHNRKMLDNMINKLVLGYEWSQRLNVEGGFIYQIVKPYYDKDIDFTSSKVPVDILDNRFGAVGSLSFQWRDNIQLIANAEMTQGTTLGNAYHLNSHISLSLFSGFYLKSGLRLNSALPTLNYYYNQSFYDKLNYYHTDLDNESSQEIYASLSSKKIGFKAEGKLVSINNFTFIDNAYNIKQSENPLRYFNLGISEHYKYQNFGVNIQALYQRVVEQEFAFPVPDIISRATIYYEGNAFKDNMHFLTGLSAHYFSSFNSRLFLPVLNEFNLQGENSRKIGNYPKLDAFINMKVRRMRIYIRAQNLNSFFMPGKNFYTPNQPSRDFKIQLGIHWYLFT